MKNVVLAYMYMMGEGVLQDEILAYALVSLAATEGIDAAVETRDGIAKSLSKEEILRGREIAASILKNGMFPDN